MNQALMKALVEVMAFLELSDDDIVDPDAAIRMMEEIVAELQRLTRAERQSFIDFVGRMAADEAAANGRTPRLQFLERVPESSGLL